MDISLILVIKISKINQETISIELNLIEKPIDVIEMDLNGSFSLNDQLAYTIGRYYLGFPPWNQYTVYHGFTGSCRSSHFLHFKQIKRKCFALLDSG